MLLRWLLCFGAIRTVSLLGGVIGSVLGATAVLAMSDSDKVEKDADAEVNDVEWFYIYDVKKTHGGVCMIIKADKYILSLLNQSRPVPYLLDWILGYIHSPRVKQILPIVNYGSDGYEDLDIPDELYILIKKNLLISDDNFDACINTLLMTAILLGEGE